MERSDVLAKVLELVSETLEVEEDKLDEATAYADLGADSFDMLELVTSMEDEFGVSVDEEALAQIETVGDSVDLIAREV